MVHWISTKVKKLRAEARACLHLARFTYARSERQRLREESIRLALAAEQASRNDQLDQHVLRSLTPERS